MFGARRVHAVGAGAATGSDGFLFVRMNIFSPKPGVKHASIAA